jgi:hypothetical protein
MSKKIKPKRNHLNENEKYPLPIYKEEDDIYNREKEVPLKNDDDPKEIRINENAKGPGLDIPGAELDDSSEAIGEEDEENNYYSLGSDRHEDLEEDDQ